MKKLLIPIIAIALFSSCKKKEDDPKPLTAKEKITSGKYFVKSMYFDRPITVTSTGVVTNNALIAAPCLADDQITFLSSNVTFEDDLNLMCDANKIESYTWSISDDNTYLVWNSKIYQVKQNDGNTLVLYYISTDDIPNLTITLMH